MARPKRRKRICREPICNKFYGDGRIDCPIVRMSLEEYEVIRLIDYLSMTQEESGAQMGVARTTIQALYRDARRKMSRYLVEGGTLIIEGGEAELCCRECTETISCCGIMRKGEDKMKIAVTYDMETGEIYQHFGHTKAFKVYEIQNKSVLNSSVIDTEGSGHSALADLLKENGVSVLICGGIGGGARNTLAEADIELYPGAMGDADANVESLLKGNLSYNPNIVCNHHSEEHNCAHNK